MLRAVLFDLDGTLLDTLDDLTDACNYALKQLGFPVRSRDQIRQFVGNGIMKLIERALPEGQHHRAGECREIFAERYSAHMEDKTKPYPGVMEMLDELKNRGVMAAVISNKFDGAVKPLCEKYFGDKLALSAGEKAGVPRKPAPDGCLLLMERLGVNQCDVLYVGDSDTDVETAHNAGLKCAGVTWGFRPREVLEAAGAEYVVDDMDGLMEVINRW